jgi:hypothetical protein
MITLWYKLIDWDLRYIGKIKIRYNAQVSLSYQLCLQPWSSEGICAQLETEMNHVFHRAA